MVVRINKSGAGLVVLRFGNDELRMWLPQAKAPDANAPPPRRPTRPLRTPHRRPERTPLRTDPKKPVPGSPPLPPFAMVITGRDKQSTVQSPFDGVVMQVVRKANLKTPFSLPYTELLTGSKGDVAKAIDALRQRLAHLRSIDPRVLNVWVGKADRVGGVDIKRLQTLVNDPKVGLSAVRIVFIEPKRD